MMKKKMIMNRMNMKTMKNKFQSNNIKCYTNKWAIIN